MDNQPVVFISHAGVDSKYAELLIDLIREIGVARENILCTSVVGYRIEQGKHWNNELRDVFLKRNPYMIFLHSDNFYKSPVCMNEVGAAWVLNLNSFSLLVPGFDYENMASVITSTVLSTKIDDPIEVIFEYFCNLKDDLIKRYGIESPKEAVWYRAVNKFQQESLKMAEPPADNETSDKGTKDKAQENLDLASLMSRPPIPIAANKNQIRYVDESILVTDSTNREVILSYLKQQARPCKVSEISSFAGLAVTTTKQKLMQLYSDGLVEVVGSGAIARFSIKTNK